VTETSPADWSPADDPHATALSEAQWWQRAARLAILRLRGRDGLVGGFSSHQIDARQLVVALRQILAAEHLEQLALKELGIDPRVGTGLTKARQQFEETLPGIKNMRDALTHFDAWSLGKGHGQREQVKAGAVPRDVARDFWGFGYDPSAETVSMGPYKIGLTAAATAADQLSWAIYLAAREVDKKRIAEVRTNAVSALTDAGLFSGGDAIRISPGGDLRISISLKVDAANPDGEGLSDLATRIAAVFTDAGLRLVAASEPQSKDTTERLARGENLQVERVSGWLSPAKRGSGDGP
jgi:hypothetical protein